MIGGGGDLTASPKYNKSNSRGYNREIQQQQKQYRGNSNREQRGGGNSRYRNPEQNNTHRVSSGIIFQLLHIFERSFLTVFFYRMKGMIVLILLVWMMKIRMMIQMKFSISKINIPANVVLVALKRPMSVIYSIFIIWINNALMFVEIDDQLIRIIMQIIDHYQLEILPIDNHFRKNNFCKQSKLNLFEMKKRTMPFCFQLSIYCSSRFNGLFCSFC